METRTERRERMAAIKLRDDAIAKLKEQNHKLKKENCELREELMSAHSQLTREMNINDSLVKHSHILFKMLSKQQENASMSRIKQVGSLYKNVKAVSSPNELEMIFFGSIADVTKG